MKASVLGEPFYYEMNILERHLDSMGHVNNSKYLEILEEARWEMITTRGYGMDEVLRTGIAPIVVEINLRFHKELRLREKILIETKYVEIRSRVSRFEQSILNEKKELCCFAVVRGALMNLHTRKLMVPTEKWLTAMGLHSEFP